MYATTREAMYAGSWYPGTKKEILDTLNTYFNNAKKEIKVEGEIAVVVAPHAGWIYSGQVAAYAFKYVQGNQYDAVVLMGASHHEYLTKAALPSFSSYSNPLGEIQIDSEAVQFLINYTDVFVIKDSPHIPEHSLEIELPFLQYSLKPGWKLVPIVFGQLDYHSLVSAAKALAELSKKKKVLVVVSTDMSHYHPYEEAVKMDKKAIDLVTSFDISGLISAVQNNEVEFCGIFPLLSGMLYASQVRATQVYDLIYKNSGDVIGDKSRVVGYTAILFSKSATQKDEGDFLSTDAKKELLILARKAIEHYLKTGKKIVYHPHNKELKELGAAFVTLEKHGNLRGCIGQIIAMEPLYESVIDMAIAAASNDPRFSPVKSPELKDIEIEISVLSPMKRITKPEEIVVGRDGLYIKMGPYSGLLLPQVATDYGWDRKEFLKQVCYKAGLPPDAWKSPKAELFTFQAIVFSESDLGLK